MTDNRNHRLHQLWEAEARNLVLAGYQRRDYPNPSVPSTFHRNGSVVILVRKLDSDEWYPKEIEAEKPPAREAAF